MTGKTMQELLEPELRGLPVAGGQDFVALSIAISLRRIADAVARSSSKLVAEAGFADDGTAHRHHSVAEMAHECATHHGVMILDVDREADGREYAHAIATWETDGGAVND
jgi:hypothetical protein